MHLASASSIGPPMMKNRSLTPSAFRHFARISEPVSSAIAIPFPNSSSRCRPGPADPLTRRAESPAFAGIRSKRKRRLLGAALFVSLVADDFLLTQRGEVARAHLEPFAEHLRGVLTELRRRLQLRRLAVEAHRPGLAFPIPVRVVHDLHDAALVEAGIVEQLERVVDGTGRDAGRADDL